MGPKENVGEKTILFICTGNLCRSPIAEALMAQRLAQAGERNIRVKSGGTWAAEGAAAPANTVRVMAERGLDIRGHRAHTVNEADMAAASLVLGMTRDHVEALRLDFPAHAAKIHLFSQMAGRRFDVPDPYGSSLAVYRQAADVISTVLAEGYGRMITLLSAKENPPEGE